MNTRISYIIKNRGIGKMNSLLVRLFAILGLLASSMLVMTGATAATLDGISYSSLPGEKVQVEMDLSEPLSSDPLNFTIDNPARVVLDFPDTSLNLAQKNMNIGIGAAHSVSAVEAAGRTRVVLNLTKSVGYDMQVQGNKVILILAAAGGSTSPSTSASVASRGAAGAKGSIENIDFRRGEHGEGRILVTLSDPSIPVNLGQEGGKVVVDFAGASLPENLNRKLDVIDFATPVKEIDTSPGASGTRMVISTTTTDFDHLAYQSDNELTIEFKPLTKAEQEAAQKEKFGYTGERLSLNFQDIEVRAVLQLIADFTGLNMVASDTVTGNVTLRLKNVPWDQALDIVLKSKGLGMRKDGNVVMVAPQAEIAAREKLELEANKQIEELAPLQTEFMQVNYAKASELAKLIKAEANNLLSARGNVSIDDRTNTLIVQDVPDSLESIRDMIGKLDIPVRQVLIESRIVNADETFSKDLGVSFAGTDTSRSFGDDETDTSLDGDWLVGLPVAGATGVLGLSYGIFDSYLINLQLSAAQAEGRTEDIANPKVITSNQTEATIESGVEIPYQQSSSSGATTVVFKKAVLSLNVTPQITPDDRILLDLEVNQDTRGADVNAGVNGVIPSINTKKVSTQVLVDNGETVVLGGVYTQTQNNSVQRVPFFGDLPYVGFLFKRKSNANTKSELLIFITPKVLKENLKI